jgi:DNA end-binding protein Ku
MTARAIWKGVIRLGRHEVPVQLYAATVDPAVHFRLLHRKDKQPVRQRLIHSETGKEVPRDSAHKGAEIDRGVFVRLDEKELAELEPAASRTINVERFVADEALDHEWYNRSYYLGPDGDDKAYGSLVKVLQEERKEGIARWVMRKKDYIGSLTVRQGVLALVTLRFWDEVVRPAEIASPPSKDLKPAEVKMARQLIATLARPFDPTQFRDHFNMKIRAFIEKKARGGKISVKKIKAKPQPPSLEEALKASLAATRGRASHG